MTRLATSDLRAVLEFLGDATSVDGPDPFPQPLLIALGGLVPNDAMRYCELDRVRRTTIRLSELACDVEGPEEPTYWDIRKDHPVCHQHETTGDFSAAKISDFLTTSELRRTDIYWDWFRPWAIEHELTVGLDAPLNHTKVFLFDRAGGRDFTERDRAVLDFLRPHLANLWEAAQARRRAAQALELLDEADAGLVILDGAGRIEHATPKALRLLSAYFRDYRSGLPEEIAAWMLEERQAPSPEPLPNRGRRAVPPRPSCRRRAPARGGAVPASADRARTRDPRPGRSREDERRDRRGDLDRARNRPQAPREHLREARRP